MMLMILSLMVAVIAAGSPPPLAAVVVMVAIAAVVAAAVVVAARRLVANLSLTAMIMTMMIPLCSSGSPWMSGPKGPGAAVSRQLLGASTVALHRATLVRILQELVLRVCEQPLKRSLPWCSLVGSLCFIRVFFWIVFFLPRF
jgi:hypothetical protein